MKKRHPSAAVLLEKKAYDLYSSLREGDNFKKAIDKGLDALKNDMFAGERIRKDQIPRYYVNRFGVNNLYRLRLDRARRCCYTIVADGE